MVRKASWHMISTELLTRVILAVAAATLGSLGVYFSSPVLPTMAGFMFFVLIYRLRYKHL